MFNNFRNFAKNLSHKSLSTAKRFKLFTNAWNQLACFIIENEDVKVSLHQTSIPEEVNLMMAMLRVEQQDMGGSGPCLEYLLKHKILDALCSLAHDDVPVGVKPFILHTLSLFIEEVDSSVIPHVNLYGPYKRMMTMCYIVNHPLEEDYVKFLCAITKRLRVQPECAGFFLSVIQGKSPELGVKSSKGVVGEKRRFFLLEGLTHLLGSEDFRIVNMACLGILDCLEIKDGDIAEAVVESGSLISVLVGRLVSLYLSLPINICEKSYSTKNNFKKKPVKERFASFLTWFEFTNDVINHSHEIIGFHITNKIRDDLIKAIVLPRLHQSSEQIAFTCTVYLHFWLNRISSIYMLDIIVDLLLGDDLRPEKKTPKDPVVYQLLLDRCESLNPQLTSTTLHLFTTLFSKNSSMVYSLLIGRNFQTSPKVTIVDEDDQFLPYESNSMLSSPIDFCRLKSIVEKWMSLVPDTNSDQKDTSLYVHEANQRFIDWAKKERRNLEYDGDIEEVPFYAGHFLQMLLVKMDSFLDLPYEEMLLITGLITEICYMGNTHVMNFLLDPNFPAEATLYKSLQGTSEYIQGKCSEIPNIAYLLEATNSSIDNDTKNGIFGDNENIDNNDTADKEEEEEEDPLLDELKPFLQGVIVFNEFCKELSAMCVAISTHPAVM